MEYNGKRKRMSDEYYDELFEIGYELYCMNGSGEYDWSILNGVAFKLYELTSKQFDAENYIAKKYEVLKDNIYGDVCRTNEQLKKKLEQEYFKLQDELREEYEKKYEEFKKELLETYES